MNSTIILTALLVLVIVVFIFVRQVIQQPVTQRSLLLPVIVCITLGVMFLLSHPTLTGIGAVMIGTLLGVGTGLLSGQLIRVWRDEATDIVFQRGGWPYLLVLIALLLARVLLRFVFLKSGSAIDETALNAALIAALMGNFLGRDIHIAQRALSLVGGSLAKLSGRAQ